MTRAFYRSYVAGSRLAGQVRRVHIERLPSTEPRKPRKGDRPFSWESGHYGWCGIQSGEVTRSAAVWLDPMPDVLPEGMSWCPACIGRLADHIGQLDRVGAFLARYLRIAAEPCAGTIPTTASEG